MFVTPAYAQGAGGGAGGFDVSFLFMMAAIFAVMYFLIIRPQQKRAKAHRDMVSNVRRGDTVVTNGGLIGKVSKVVDDTEIMVEISDGVRIRVVRGMIMDVRSKGEPVKDEK